MPNICSFNCRFIGKKKDVHTFMDWFKANYSYAEFDFEKGEYVEFEKPRVFVTENGVKRDVEHHIGYRVFEYTMDNETPENAKEDDVVTVDGIGDCAWSLNCCVMTTCLGYINEFKDEKNRRVISLEKACRKLNVMCEFYSYESGMCFAEHIVVDKYGKVLINEEREYQEIYISEYETFEDMEKDYIKNNWELPFDEKRFNWYKEDGVDYVPVSDFYDEIVNCSFSISEKDFSSDEIAVGTKLHIIRMDGEPQYTDKIGVVTNVDDMGQIFGTWGGCALIKGLDTYEIVKDEETSDESDYE